MISRGEILKSEDLVRRRPPSFAEVSVDRKAMADIIFLSRGKKNCGPERDRTDDLLRARQALSQLSYGPTLM